MLAASDASRSGRVRSDIRPGAALIAVGRRRRRCTIWACRPRPFPSRPRSPSSRRPRCWRRAGAVDVLQRGDRVHDRPGRAGPGHGRGPVSAATDLLTVVGSLLGAQPGESLRLRGRWSSHPKYGRQFEVDSYTTVLPATIQGIRRYLGSGLIKGHRPGVRRADRRRTSAWTPCTSSRTSPAGLSRSPGLGPKRTAKITAAWAEQKAIKEVMVFLQGCRGVHLDRGADLQEVRRRVHRRVVKHRALPAGRRRVGHRVQDRRHDRAGGRHPARQPAAGQGRPAVYPVRGRPTTATATCPSTALVTDATKILGRARRPGHAAASPTWSPRRASSGRVPVPGRRRRPVQAVYLVPFHRADEASPLRCCRLLRPGRPDAALPRRRLGQGVHLAAGAHRHRPRPRAGAGGPARADLEGRGADRRPRLRQELHRPLRRRTRRGASKAKVLAGRPDRPGRQTPRRTDRPPRRHHPPAAQAAARRRRRATTGTTPSTSTCWSSTRPRCST